MTHEQKEKKEKKKRKEGDLVPKVRLKLQVIYFVKNNAS